MKETVKRQWLTDNNEQKIAPYTTIDQVISATGERLDTHLENYKDDINNTRDVLIARMDNFVTLPEGNTTGDAEIADIRVGRDGTVYPNAGTAVREQISKHDKEFETIVNKGVETFNVNAQNKTNEFNQNADRMNKISQANAESAKADAESAKQSAENFIVDVEMSDDSTNPVQNKVAKLYIDENINYLAEFKTHLRNAIDSTDFTAGESFTGNVGEIISNSNWNMCNKYAEVKPETNYYLMFGNWQLSIYQAIMVEFFDENKKALTKALYGENGVVVAPAKAKYVRAAWSSALNAENLYVSAFSNKKKLQELFDKYAGMPFGYEVEIYSSSLLDFTQKNNVLYGKKLVACGDSITDAYDLEAMDGSYIKSYAQLTAERNGMNFVKNAVSGSTMAYNAGGSTEISTRAFSNTRYKEIGDFDYLTIWFGWNDNAYSKIGTIEDTDNTTFYGAYKIVLEYLIKKNPTKKIGLVVPYGDNQKFAQAVRELSIKYGVPCLDLKDYNECSLLWGMDNDTQLARRSALTFDGTHPNQAGHKFLSTMYEQFLKRL